MMMEYYQSFRCITQSFFDEMKLHVYRQNNLIKSVNKPACIISKF